MEITPAFKIASDSFDYIRLKPKNDDLQRLNEVLAVTSFSINLTRTGYVVLTEALYNTNNIGYYGNEIISRESLVDLDQPLWFMMASPMYKKHGRVLINTFTMS